MKTTEKELAHLNLEQVEELEKALEQNTPEFNTLKLIEELAELQEKLIKYHLKAAENKPKLTEILDEVGDVELRIALFVDQFINDEFSADEYISERLVRKTAKLYSYFKEGKYKGGL